MASTTALTMVNQLLRRHGFEDYSTFTLPETLLGLDLVNHAIRDLLAARDYPWNVRSDGTLVIRAEVTGTAGATISAESSVLTITGATGVSTDYTGGTSAGELVTRVLFTGATSFNSTAIRVSDLSITAGTMTANLATPFPVAVSNGAYKFFFSEYLLPDSVGKILSVRDENQPLRMLEVFPHHTWDEVNPRPHDYESADIMAVGVGGVATSTAVTGALPNQRLRLMVWPVPTSRRLLYYSYKERVTQLVATTDVLTAPSEFVDDVIDRAEALSNMTQRFNDPNLAQIQFSNSARTAERKYENATLDPARRNSMKPHDGGVRRRDWTRYRDIQGL